MAFFDVCVNVNVDDVNSTRVKKVDYSIILTFFGATRANVTFYCQQFDIMVSVN